MTQYNDMERQAGTLILSQLKMFNEAVVFFERHIEPAFWKGFDQCVEHFIKTNNWLGSAKFAQKEYLWIAPASWKTGPKQWKSWFDSYNTTKEGFDYHLSVITQANTEQGEFGFLFKLDSSWSGDHQKLNSDTDSIDLKYRKQLIDLGFDYQGKDSFFIPVALKADKLAECWQEYGAFPEEHEIFTPLREALDKLLQSVEIFDAIFPTTAELL